MRTKAEDMQDAFDDGRHYGRAEAIAAIVADLRKVANELRVALPDGEAAAQVEAVLKYQAYRYEKREHEKGGGE